MRSNSSMLCCSTSTVSADVMHPAHARQSLSVTLATFGASSSSAVAPSVPSIRSTRFFLLVSICTGFTQASDGVMKSDAEDSRTEVIGSARLRALFLRAPRAAKVDGWRQQFLGRQGWPRMRTNKFGNAQASNIFNIWF